MASRVALVTGANQGIGLQIVRELCKKFEGTVVLASRSLQRGEDARKLLKSEGLHPSLLQLDVNSTESIHAARDIVKEKFGQLDVLVNNAGILIREGKTFSEAAFETIRTNYYGVLNVTEAFSPLLQPNSRIVNMSSQLGNTSAISARRKEQLLDPAMTVQKLSEFMDEFVKDAQSPDYETKGWVDKSDTYATYRISKMGVYRLTELLAQTIGKDPSKPGILINSMHPGWVKTSMGTANAPMTVEQGADTAVYLALLPAGTSEPNGLYLQRRKPREWKK